MHQLVWFCPFCGNRNNLPPDYRGAPPATIPEVNPGNQTIEYILPSKHLQPTIAFLFVIDTCQDEQSVGKTEAEQGLEKLKESLINTIQCLPENAHVGLVTYGKMVSTVLISQVTCRPSQPSAFTDEYHRRKFTKLDMATAPNPTFSGVHASIPQRT